MKERVYKEAILRLGDILIRGAVSTMFKFQEVDNWEKVAFVRWKECHYGHRVKEGRREMSVEQWDRAKCHF